MSATDNSELHYVQSQEFLDFLNFKSTVGEAGAPSQDYIDASLLFAEEELEERIGHAWREKQVLNEVHDLPKPRQYQWGFGLIINLSNRSVKNWDTSKGDAIGIWDGLQYSDILKSFSNTGVINLQTEFGELGLRGWFNTWFKFRKFKITYRFGEEKIPYWVKTTVKKIAGLEFLKKAWTLDVFDVGGQVTQKDTQRLWEQDVNDIVQRYQEFKLIDGN